MKKYKITVAAWKTIEVHANNLKGAEISALASMNSIGMRLNLWDDVEVTNVILKHEEKLK